MSFSYFTPPPPSSSSASSSSSHEHISSQKPPIPPLNTSFVATQQDSSVNSLLVTSPPSSTSTSFTTNNYYHYAREQLLHQTIFADKQTRLLSVLDSTRSLLNHVRDTNRQTRSFHYPPLAPQQFSSPSDRDSENAQNTVIFPGRSNFSPMRRALSYCRPPAEGTETEEPVAHENERRHSTTRTTSSRRSTSAQGRRNSAPTTPSTTHDPNSHSYKSLNVLSLDLKMGNTLLDTVSSLAPETVSNLLDERLSRSLQYLDALSARLSDSSSKVLVTGDLNAGKSTFVNALLRKEILPVDQQPCTTLFCEVLDARENSGVEEVHAISMNAEKPYDREDPDTYVRVDMRHLEKLVDGGHRQYSHLKVYCNDNRPDSESLLHNGVVDIALVDSPGLNRDSLKTTALFARQQEIDVVVFVVNAENHFTLSGKEFLWNAGNEKAHIFIVVNRFDLIRKKDKCRREILEQIRQLSPHTYEDADDLVHFVSAEDCFPEVNDDENEPGKRESRPIPESFAKLEQCLRAFTLDKRAKSKLAPAKRYLSNLLSDLTVIASWNLETHTIQLAQVTRELEQDAPALDGLVQAKKLVNEKTEHLVEETSRILELSTRSRLDTVIDAMEVTIAETVEWNGIFSAWSYAVQVRDRLVEMVVGEMNAAEVHAREMTAEGVRAIRELGKDRLAKMIPSDPEREQNSGQSAGSVSGSEITKFEQESHQRDQHLLVLRVDFFDFLMDPRERLNMMNLSMGAFAMVGTKMLGFQKVIGAVWTVGSWIGMPKMRVSRLTWLTIGIAGAGTLSYLLSDIPRTVERRLAHKFRDHLIQMSYSDTQSSRLARRSRRQLRLAGWDLQNRFHLALEREERKRSDRLSAQSAAREAVEYFADLEEKAEQLCVSVNDMDVDVFEELVQPLSKEVKRTRSKFKTLPATIFASSTSTRTCA